MYNQKSFTPNEAARLAAFNHVLYEMEMFVALPRASDVPVISNAVTESLLIHARVLCDFFQKSRYRDDIVCEDYGFPSRSLGISEDIEMRFDKCLAHVTYSRTCFTDDAKEWLLRHFRPALLSRIAEFLSIVTTASPTQIRDEDHRRACRLLENLPPVR